MIDEKEYDDDLVQLFTTAIGHGDSVSARELMAQIEAKVSQEPVILSDEGFLWPEYTERWHITVEQRLALLKELIPDARWIVVTRSHADWYRSLYQMQSKTAKLIKADIEAWTAGLLQKEKGIRLAYSQNKLIERMEALNSNLTVVRFENIKSTTLSDIAKILKLRLYSSHNKKLGKKHAAPSTLEISLIKMMRGRAGLLIRIFIPKAFRKKILRIVRNIFTANRNETVLFEDVSQKISESLKL